MARGKQWGETKAQSFGNESWDKKVEWYTFPSGEEQRIRLIGSVYLVGRHWPTLLTKFVHGQKPKVYPTWCTKFNSVTEELDPERVCPLCDDFDMYLEKLAVSNVIIRKFQEGRTNRVNPVVPVIWRHSDVDKVFKKAVEKFKADPADPKKGCDFSVEYDPNSKKNRWTIQREDQTPLTDEEKQYELTDFESLIPDYEDAEVMAADARDMKKSIARSGYYVIPLRNGEDGWASYRADQSGKPYTSYPDLVAYKEAGKTGGAVGSAAHSTKDKDDDNMPAARRARSDDGDTQQVARPKTRVTAPPPDEDMGDAEPEPVQPQRTVAKVTAKAPPKEEPEDAVIVEDDSPPPVVTSARVKPKAPVVVVEEAPDDAPPEEDEPAPAPPPKVATKPKTVVAAVAPAGKATTPVASKHEAWTAKFGIVWENKDGKNLPNCWGEYAGAKKCTSCPESNACIEASDSN